MPADTPPLTTEDLHGKPGRGKTHLAIAIAYRAIQNGFDALFVTAAALIEEHAEGDPGGRGLPSTACAAR